MKKFILKDAEGNVVQEYQKLFYAKKKADIIGGTVYDAEGNLIYIASVEEDEAFEEPVIEESSDDLEDDWDDEGSENEEDELSEECVNCDCTCGDDCTCIHGTCSHGDDCNCDEDELSKECTDCDCICDSNCTCTHGICSREDDCNCDEEDVMNHVGVYKKSLWERIKAFFKGGK